MDELEHINRLECDNAVVDDVRWNACDLSVLYSSPASLRADIVRADYFSPAPTKPLSSSLLPFPDTLFAATSLFSTGKHRPGCHIFNTDVAIAQVTLSNPMNNPWFLKISLS
jgi:hypothetical protein